MWPFHPGGKFVAVRLAESVPCVQVGEPELIVIEERSVLREPQTAAQLLRGATTQQNEVQCYDMTSCGVMCCAALSCANVACVS